MAKVSFRCPIRAERKTPSVFGITAARAGDHVRAEKLTLAAIWSKWGHRYKYQGSLPDVDRAANAFERSLHWQPTYGFAYYELGAC